MAKRRHIGGERNRPSPGFAGDGRFL